MSTKGRVGGLKEEKGRSPTLPSGQRRGAPNPSILDKKKGSVSTQSRKVSTSNLKKQPSDTMKPPRSLPPSKVTSTRSKPNENNVTRPSTKITGSTKPKDAGKPRPPLRPKNVVNVKENTNVSKKKQTKKGLENNSMVISEQNRTISDAPPSSKSDHNIVTHEDDNKTIVTHEDDNKTIPVFNDIAISDCNKQLLEDENDDILNNVVEISTPLCDPIGLSGNQDKPEYETSSQNNITIDGSVDHEHPNGRYNEINVQDRANKTSEFASDRLLVPDLKFAIDQENEGLEIEGVAQDSYIGSKDVENIESKDQEHEEPTQKEPEYEKTDPKEAEHEETDSKEPEQEEIEPKEPVDEEIEVPKEQEHQETEVLVLEPENKETEAAEEPDYEETELKELETKEPENEKTEPKEVEQKETEKRKHQETEEPKEAEKKGKLMVVKKQEVVAYGKKETTVAYNDVIEETVSKLIRSQRKTRVKALVGAFETVISLESDE